MKAIVIRHGQNPGLAGTIVVVFILGILTGCTFWSTGPIIDASVLTSSSCELPCWHGITPGTVMTEEQIVQILEELPEVGLLKVQQFSGYKDIWWSWSQKGQDLPRRDPHNYVSLDTPGGTVRGITLQVVFDLPVQEVLERHGKPEGVILGRSLLTGDRENWIVSLFYPSRGMGFEVGIPWWRGAPCILEPTAKVFEVFYFPARSLQRWTEENPEVPLIPWPGYGEVSPAQP